MQVQCCSDTGECSRTATGGKCFSGDNDAAKMTFEQASAVCSQSDKRLCTKVNTANANYTQFTHYNPHPIHTEKVTSKTVFKFLAITLSGRNTDQKQE